MATKSKNQNQNRSDDQSGEINRQDGSQAVGQRGEVGAGATGANPGIPDTIGKKRDNNAMPVAPDDMTGDEGHTGREYQHTEDRGTKSAATGGRHDNSMD